MSDVLLKEIRTIMETTTKKVERNLKNKPIFR
jgi:hypothetical protein